MRKERADNFRIVTAHPCHSADRQYQYRQIQAAGQDIVESGKSVTVANNQNFLFDNATATTTATAFTAAAGVTNAVTNLETKANIPRKSHNKHIVWHL